MKIKKYLWLSSSLIVLFLGIIIDRSGISGFCGLLSGVIFLLAIDL